MHGRPEGAGESPVVLGIWTYDVEPVEPEFPIAFDPASAEIVLRGLSRMIPALGGYAQRLPRSFVDGGYYTKTRGEPLPCLPAPRRGRLLLGGLSGYGLMSSNGAADLLADHIVGRPLPALCGRLPPGPLRRPRLPGPPHELGGLGPALGRDET